MGLSIHRADRADLLADALGRLLTEPLADPIASEIVAVPTRGVERWLSQRLSHVLGRPMGGSGPLGGGGVCANIDFPFPGTLIGQATAAACGVDPANDPWRPERCVWPLIEVMDRHAEDPELSVLTAHLRAATPAGRRGDEQPIRRFATARHLADLFDHYAVHRPDLIIGWADGADPDPPGTAADGGISDPTPRWQRHLWRLLRARLGTPSWAERFTEAAAGLAENPGLLDLPERISLFGLTRLPASYLQVLQAIAVGRDVHLLLLHPSGRLWDAVAREAPAPAPDLVRADDPTARLAANPLLRSWGRDAREMQLVLAGRGITGGAHHSVNDAPDDSPETWEPRLLDRVQADVRGDLRPPGRPPAGRTDPRPLLDRHDRSLQVHACHGRGRQVEVLRDALLHLLAEDETLEARDIIVMCPDIETFAPLVYAAFGAGDPLGPEPGDASEDDSEASGVPKLRVRLADRSLRQTNPLLGVAAHLLTLSGSRITASQVLDLASRPPVARRFGFDQDDLSTLEKWVAGTGIRWGLDAAHRRPWALEDVAANTWSSGLDRLLLGATMAEVDCRLFGGTVPYDDVPSNSVDLAGRAAELLHRLGAAVDRLSKPQSIGTWVEALVEGTRMIAATGPSDDWQAEQLRRVLGEVAEQAGAGAAPQLSLDEVRSLLDARLQGRPTRANFRTGDLTICTLVPMRSVPHRVVAILGLDDGAFPRHPETDGDDLLLGHPRVGDRDARSEDRQLILDALLAATDHLVLTYSGRDERTNRPRPPAVPLAELLDVVDSTVRGPDSGPARDHVVVHHPLQPFDRRNFTPGLLYGESSWSYDRVNLNGSLAAAAQEPARPWLDGPLPALDEPVLQLEYLVNFVEHPVRAFLRRRLGLYLSNRSDQLLDGVPLELDSLEKWGVGDRLLQASSAGIDVTRAARAERARGLLPPESLADSVLREVSEQVDALANAVEGLGFQPGPADSVDVHVDLPDGRTLIGTVPNVRGSTLVHCTYSRLAPKHRLAAWVRFLALSAARPDLPVGAVTIGRGQSRQPPRVARLDPLGTTAGLRRAGALAALDDLLYLYDLALREPVPLACATSAAWAEALHSGLSDDAYQRAETEWKDGLFPGEISDPEHVYVWGRATPLADLMADPPDPDDNRPEWTPGETTRFAALARRLWGPLLRHEERDR